MPDGKVIYSDVACPEASQETRTIIKKAPTPSSSIKLPPPEPIEFTGNPRTDYIKSTAIIDNIRIIGRDCEWALKVDKSKIQKCFEFMGKLQPGGEFQQVTDHVSMLNRDRKSAEQSMSEIRTMTRYMEDIVRYKEFMMASLGVKSK